MVPRKISFNMGFAQSFTTSGNEEDVFGIENAYSLEFILMICFQVYMCIAKMFLVFGWGFFNR